MPIELPIHYDFHADKDVYAKWQASGLLDAVPDARTDRFVIMMPLPNVTGALHMGHAMDNVMQDLLIRFNRMKGKNTLWMPGVDHAGIATQAVVEKRLLELEGRTRSDIGREALVDRIWHWKDEYQTRIIDQQKQMGCSCAWDLHRFTMDAVCARAVREAFYRMFKDGLIYRGNRMVNWDCQLETAVSDDEIIRETVAGQFWHLTYRVIDPEEGEPATVVVATTRPETMLGDTAVAVHPDPEHILHSRIEAASKRMAKSSAKERPSHEAEIALLEERVLTRLPLLLRLRDMANSGRKIQLPLIGREVPLILDTWADPALGSGCVKVTPSHDPNDYEVWKRHQDEIGIINLLNPDGSYNENAGRYAGLDREEVRKRVLEDLRELDLIEQVEEREIELGFSDRSKTPIEPYVSKQWFVNMGDIEGGITCGVATGNEFKTDGLAQAAIDAVSDGWQSPTGRKLTFFPDGERYRGTFVNWLEEKRDWCISRQLWWGHQIPIWHGPATDESLQTVRHLVERHSDKIFAWIADDAGELRGIDRTAVDNRDSATSSDPTTMLVCIRGEDDEAGIVPALIGVGLDRDPDVLDTWFSSGLWPFSTLGWPDPESAEIDDGGTPLGAPKVPSPAGGSRPAGVDAADAPAGPTPGTGKNYLQYYYPGTCLVTARDIITLWVARMTVMGLYLLGDVPFTDCFIHANIQDGKGERMSKSKGNGIDPVDIISEYGSDAMRYVVSDLQTGTQDIKLPVQAISPFTGKRIELATAEHGQSIFTYIDPDSGDEFDVLGTIEGLPKARITSDRFDTGKSFCTKLWNATRFALLNLDQHEFAPIGLEQLAPEDKWILSRTAATVLEVTENISAYNPSAALAAARDYFWGELCDWYLEIIKARLGADEKAATARSVLSFCLDTTLRLLHPFVPFITETLWNQLNTQTPHRGIAHEIETGELLVSAAWPIHEVEYRDGELESEFSLVQSFVRSVRELRSRYNISLSKPISALVRADGAAAERLRTHRRLIIHLTNLTRFEVGPDLTRPQLAATAVVGDSEVYLEGVLDPAKERAKLESQRTKLLKAKGSLEQKLGNPGFLKKAPPKVVEGERQRLRDSAAELEVIEHSLDTLSGQ